MTPDEVSTANGKLLTAMMEDDEGTSLGMGIALLCGAAFNIARIAEVLTSLKLSDRPAPHNPETTP